MTTEIRQINPFPGLRPFRPDEDYLFFGREEQTMELLERLETHRFLAVVGTSGSGKSSLVRCGLLSELQGGNMLQAGTLWEIAVTHPGGHPMSLLADALLEAGIYDAAQVEAKERLLATLSRSHFGLVEAVRQAHLPEGTNFLLVVDQFEELFRFNAAGRMQSEVAHEFVSILLEATAQTEVPIYVVLTMRSDFIGDCSQFERLAEAINAGEYLIPRLTWDQYKRVIEGPVRVGQAEIAPRLLQRLLNDVRHQQDQLPCLQHALMRTWDIWTETDRSQPLDLEHYELAGRTTRALSLHADEVYAGLASDRQRTICEALFKALTVRESEQRGIRRPQSLIRLCEIIGVDQSELAPVIEAYRRPGVTFLMPPTDVKLQENTVIDISHESLMRVWQRLRRWVDQEAQSVRIFHRLAESATLYAGGKAGLYRDPELGVALAWRAEAQPNAAWAEQYGGHFDEAIRYLERSREAAEIEEQQREADRQRELRQAKQLAETQANVARLFKRFAGSLAVGLLLAVVLTIWALLLRQEASRQASLAQERQRLAEVRETEASWNAYVNRVQGMARHWQEAELGQLERMLRESVPKPGEVDFRGWEWHFLHEQFSQRVHSLPIQETGMSLPINSVDFSPDGRLLATIGDAVEIWDTESKERLQHLGKGQFARCLDWSPDGARLVVGTGNWELLIWSNQHKQLEQMVKSHGTAVQDRIGFDCVAWNPDSVRLATSDSGSRLRLWNAESGRLIREIWDGSKEEDYMFALSWHPDGKRLASAHRDGFIRVWDVSTGEEIFERKTCEVSAKVACWSPNGEYLVGGGGAFDFALYVWDPDGNLVHKFENVGADINTACWRPDSRYIASGGEDFRIRIWALQEKRQLNILKVHAGAVRALSWNPDGSQIATGGSDLTVKLVDSDSTHSIAELWSQETAGVRRVAWSPKGDRLAAAVFDGTVQVYDASTGTPMIKVQGDQRHVRDFDLRLMAQVDPHDVPHARDLPGARVVVIANVDGELFFRLRDRSFWQNRKESDMVDQAQRLKELKQKLEPLWDRAELTADEKQDIIVRVASILGPPAVTEVTWSPAGDELASIDMQGIIRIWDARTGHSLREFKSNAEAFNNQLVWSPDAQYLAMAAESGEFGLLNAETGESIASNPGVFHGMYDLSWAPDGSAIAAGGKNQTLGIWYTPLSGIIGSFEVPCGANISDIAWRPDSRIVAAATKTAGVVFVDAVSGEEVYRLRGHSDYITSIAWSGDGKRIATGSADGEIKIWDAAALVELASFRAHDGEVLNRGVSGLAWSPDSSRLASCGSDGRIFVWGSAELKDHVNTRPPPSAGRVLPAPGANHLSRSEKARAVPHMRLVPRTNWRLSADYRRVVYPISPLVRRR